MPLPDGRRLTHRPFGGLVHRTLDLLGELPGTVLRQFLEPFRRALRHSLRQPLSRVGRGGDQISSRFEGHIENRIARGTKVRSSRSVEGNSAATAAPAARPVATTANGCSRNRAVRPRWLSMDWA
jgi:hypothetical protein